MSGTITSASGPGRLSGLGVVLWREHRAMLGRWIARLRREPLTIAALLAQPMIWLLLFGHLFAGMANTASVPGDSYVQFMTAGAVVMTIFNACLQGGVELLFDRETGLLSRMFAAPVHRISIVSSRFVYLVALTSAQSAIILFAAYLIGVRYATGLAGIAACLAIGAAFGAGVTSLSMVLAFSLRSHSQFFPITGFVGLPLTFVSSALVPVDLMPSWMRVLAGLNPMTHAIDGVRSLVLHGWRLDVLAATAGALLLFDLCCLALAAWVLRRKLP
ncbi:ABC transporter [Actinobacteria bacterium YIM 96077]|uniref:Transport permease protein n=1 Tax=Phytoactinopolyspora halophila TaxID=1981511 RepID=A0A329QB22_9ACTN|nr:ABC transporter permease [Phytoactinopolyspora halophila]AYY14139.1 ABC transporter [Actinobacteria bacterium YIM 96077]RAW09600.1 ABC transporter [Phytoactinopolyspora halophila]